jgi:toxin secretion/phage lysis holin
MEQASHVKLTIITIWTALSAVFTWIFGGFDMIAQVLLSLMVIDYITGVIVAGVFKRSDKTCTGGLDSMVGFKGICKKVGIILAVIIAVMGDRAIGSPDMVRNIVILFFIGNEGLSVLENLGLMGVPIPEALTNVFEQMRKKKNKKEDDEE